MKRICPKCKIEHDLCSENFHRNKCFKGGFSYRCKGCTKATSKGSWAKTSAEAKFRKNHRKKFHLRTRAVSLLNSYKKTDQKKNIEFNLTADFVSKMLSSECAYCGETQLHKLGLDRINNSLGHTITNVAPCCDECNIARSNHFTYEEMLIIGQSIKLVKEARKNQLHKVA